MNGMEATRLAEETVGVASSVLGQTYRSIDKQIDGGAWEASPALCPALSPPPPALLMCLWLTRMKETLEISLSVFAAVTELVG